jgi:hypothetical protein
MGGWLHTLNDRCSPCESNCVAERYAVRRGLSVRRQNKAEKARLQKSSQRRPCLTDSALLEKLPKSQFGKEST